MSSWNAISVYRTRARSWESDTSPSKIPAPTSNPKEAGDSWGKDRTGNLQSSPLESITHTRPLVVQITIRPPTGLHYIWTLPTSTKHTPIVPASQGIFCLPMFQNKLHKLHWHVLRAPIIYRITIVSYLLKIISRKDVSVFLMLKRVSQTQHKVLLPLYLPALSGPGHTWC